MAGQRTALPFVEERVTMKYLDIFELAELLSVSPETIRRNIRLRPWAVPPKMHIPGTRLLRWRSDQVRLWQEETQVKEGTANETCCMGKQYMPRGPLG